jgi:hypothetical protein
MVHAAGWQISLSTDPGPLPAARLGSLAAEKSGWMRSPFAWLISHQPAILFLSEQIGHQQPANSIILSEEISTSHQPPVKRTGSRLLLPYHARIMIHLRRRYMMIVDLLRVPFTP